MAEPVGSLWGPVDRANAAAAPSESGRFQWVPGAIPVIILISLAGFLVLMPEDLQLAARLALFAFGCAAILWTLTTINAAYVALGAVLLLVVGRAIEQEDLFETLESDVIWLMIGAFILGAAVQFSGLAARLTGLVAARSRNVGAMMWLVAGMLIPLSFLIPSTSGRAAVALPLFRSISTAAGNARVTRALALLIPTVILVSTISSLVGAGSHLIANDLLDEMLDETGGGGPGADAGIGFGEWMLYGLPFGVTASILSAFVISRMFLGSEERRLALPLPTKRAEPLTAKEKRTMVVAATMVALWLTAGWHGLEIATVSVLGAFILTLPGIGVLSWKDGLKSVSWNLIFFVGAALTLGEALIETGAAQWLIGRMFEVTGITDSGSPLLVLTGLTLITLTSHIYLTSHAARAAALIPPLLYLAGALDINAVAVMFIATVGMDYCLTFPVSSKALLMFQEVGRETWVPADLLRLSAVLMPIHAAMMVAFYYFYWRHVGLAL